MTRAAAVRILSEVHRSDGIFAADRIHQFCEQNRLRKRDRKFLTELVLGTLRWRRTLDCVLRAYSKVRPEDLEPKVLEALRLGIYQLLFLDGVPDFAAVHETVAVFRRSERQKRFVNGVLRAIDRQVRRLPLAKDRGGTSPQKRLEIRGNKVCFFSRKVFADPKESKAQYLSDVSSHPAELVARWLDRLGEEATSRLLQSNNTPPPLFVRFNRLRGDRERALELLQQQGVAATAGSLPASIRIHAPVTELLPSKAFRDGWVTVQDETAMKAAPALEPTPDQRILDACAAPGGKTTHLAELTGDKASIQAVDRDESRVDRIRQTCRRLKLRSVATIVMDLLDPQADPPSILGSSFDRVLIDVPCSNSGVLRRRLEARDRFDSKPLKSLVERQASLLAAVAPLVSPGGRLLYSTCSLEPEENVEQVNAFVAGHAEYRIRETVETLPAEDAGDGGFFAVLERVDV